MKVAVTGGIGSGKTELCKWIEKEGNSVFSCDQIYTELLDSNEEFRSRILDAFPAAKDAEGRLDRKVLSAIVFEDRRRREQLNGITHPLIIKELLKQMDCCMTSFAEVPLLFEGGYEKLFDKVVIVMRDEDDRIDAIMERSGLTYEEAKSRMKAQANYDKLPISKYFVVYNNGTLDDLHDKALYIIDAATGR
ncbi:MAG: dephospho-CoA kinase [Clostridia bacterium]|nr:dephospho-CoA kinase [Clostridia bacterium]